jgi:microcystin degradation protein MlrC
LTKRVFIAALGTETNQFVPFPTGRRAYEEHGVWRGDATRHEPTNFTAPLHVWRKAAEARGWTVIEGLATFAAPSGTTVRSVYEAFRDEILAGIKDCLPLDAVLINVHGAMVADGYDDCEGDLLQRVRAIVGPGVVVGAELDPHCHLTPAMVDNADLLIAYKEYPHTDVLERALELVDLGAAIVEKRIHPAAAMVDCEMIATVHTSREPARSFVDRLQAMEGKDGVLSISIAHGFPWGDVAEMGTKILVYADGDEAKARALARRLADELIGMRERLSPANPSIDAALDEALSGERGTVVISDGADNPGGGAASDATFFLRRIVERGIRDVAIGPFWDPVAARIAIEAGEGARLPLRIGGKVSPLSGDPLDLECTVKRIRLEHVQTGLSNTRAEMGDSVLVESAGVEILLCSLRNQAMGTDLFTGIGCDLAAKKIVVVKSSQHFHASYSKIAARVIYAAAPGAVTLDLRALPYRKVRRPKWPLDVA